MLAETPFLQKFAATLQKTLAQRGLCEQSLETRPEDSERFKGGKP